MTPPTTTAQAQAVAHEPGFPVDFEPGEDALLWERDRTHFPWQATTLEAELISDAIAGGLGHALRRYGVPVEEVRVRVLNGYVYQATVPMTGSPGELAEQGRRSEAVTLETIGLLRERWDEEWLPEIRAHIRAMEAVDPGNAPSVPALVQGLEEHWAHIACLWQIHFEIVLPAYVAMSEFDDFYRDLFDGSAFDAYRLLHGFEDKTFEVGRDLWRLSRLALDSPEVAAVFATEAAAEIPRALEQTASGRAFRAELDRHLAAYGHRTRTWGLASPSFIEDPAPVLNVLKDYATQPDSAGPGRKLARLAREREAAVAEARERLRGYPAPMGARFEAMLAAAQTGMVLSEDHGFWIDAYAVSLVRELLAELGRRLVQAGVLDDPEDVLMLTYDELRVPGLDLPGTDPRAVVADRRARLAEHAGAAPPPVLGTVPEAPPPDSPLARLQIKLSGTPAPSTDPDVVEVDGDAGTVRILR